MSQGNANNLLKFLGISWSLLLVQARLSEERGPGEYLRRLATPVREISQSDLEAIASIVRGATL